MLQVGGLGALGLALPELFRGRAAHAATAGDRNLTPAFGKAKSCVLVCLFGGPSHIDTFDLKPDAPSGIRGEFKPIATAVPGVQICEHFPRLARHAEKFAVVRSMYHSATQHGSGLYHMLTGHRYPVPNLDPPPRPDDFPNLGSVLARLRPSEAALPPNVTLPRWCRFACEPHVLAGQFAGFLGGTFDPWLIEADPADPDFRLDTLQLAADVGLNRLAERRPLLADLDRALAWMGETAAGRRSDALYRRAFRIVSSPRARVAFDLAREDDRLRDQYGRTPLGQGLLLARRLIEAGVQLVTVNWHNDKSDIQSPFWDTHKDNFPTLKERLIPPVDQALPALLEDLKQRGLLAETLVVVLGEFGRAPKIGVKVSDTTFSTGRDHWPYAYSVVLAGGGVRGGQVYGKTDRIAGSVIDHPTTPADLAATILTCLGIDHRREIRDHLGRPCRLSEGEPVLGLF
jgi:hypothetical protein